jgi:hypothetical protein
MESRPLCNVGKGRSACPRSPARARVSLLAIGGAALIGLRVRFRRSDPRKRNLNFGG